MTAVAFRLVPPQSTDQQLRALAQGRIDSALDHLERFEDSHDDVHVHTVRRRCKQVRALARLIRPALGDDYAPFNSAIRDAARALAPLRNAQVSHELRQSFEPTTTPTQAASAATTPEPAAKHEGAAIEITRRELRRARHLVEGWDLHDESDAHGFGLMAPGIERTYRRGRHGVDQARRDPTDESLHEWRKDVKDLWYQLRLMQPIAPSVLDPMIAQVDQLGKLLGHHHDIDLLLVGLATERKYVKKRRREGASTKAETRSALDDIRQATDRATDTQDRLEAEALRRGATIYAERPTAFVARIAAYWDSTTRWGPEPGPGARSAG